MDLQNRNFLPSFEVDFLTFLFSVLASEFFSLSPQSSYVVLYVEMLRLFGTQFPFQRISNKTSYEIVFLVT
jgi:hypothetical protein